MAFTQRQLDDLVAWAADAPDLAAERREVRRQFFGEDDPRPVKYWSGTDDSTARQKRFLGYFLFTHHLPDGRTTAEVGVDALFRGSDHDYALRAVQGARYVMVVVKSVLPGRAVFLGLEKERFEVRHSRWSFLITPDSTVFAHLIPSRRGIWLLGPGWLEMPIQLGPGIRSHLRDLQADPISVERILQQRSEEGDEEMPPSVHDDTLEAAVARMTAEAEAAGADRLVMPSEEWQALVLSRLQSRDITLFAREVLERAGATDDPDELDRWLALANNIWNNTPQPNRGGKTPNELSQERHTHSDPAPRRTAPQPRKLK